MDKKKIAEFFDAFAPSWDATMEVREAVIRDILSLSQVSENTRVLDIACGTGVLFPFYDKLGATVVGADISEEMVRIAKSKFPQKEIICVDAESYDFEKRFDVIMIHNAFPHFSDGDKLIEHLSSFLEKGGRLTVAHSMSEAELESCHSGAAKDVSLSLPSKEKLTAVMRPYLDVDVAISDERMYIVSGVKGQ